jgi:hypothetical protein
VSIVEQRIGFDPMATRRKTGSAQLQIPPCVRECRCNAQCHVGPTASRVRTGNDFTIDDQ